ncbi:MAG: hypothetical protein A2836_01260 [Candidatus Taylorbacteria bacterium RIFCSPHIGHO2_01_FULL_45_63]|uniref:Uncharacterized protein n=1 Tax=Candidatus Taylorbacteria bacterium RIFCSPHIGHO2_02_FULL_45_35 TaxID=1802311 RepID=A0A1G2MPF3_9BACT|nr:MAG: hypothetical protein A2836_01260 [Candidatus Taylorbacteria bacterium RIFCSPHIGHO2_01_FULL_45_63]OHA25777.1 MAG: hypothetical protein A3D56_01590 [Candidatus Taylorbacteria bacterium RIFCSPHIGHO2_02_FULL_45_35]OHA32294.1 MAG: hypothetical protein A3A22_01805 [Candidatus Taylorbacteria bacterium RIFCSPLOWO2_01_FULL_45_34b]
MKNFDFLITSFGVLLLFIVLKIMILGDLSLTLGFLIIGTLYLLFGLGILPLGKKVKVVLVWFFLPFLAVGGMYLNELLETNSITVSKPTFWYTDGGVCSTTIRAKCDIVDAILFMILAFVSFVVGLAKLFVTPKKRHGETVNVESLR